VQAVERGDADWLWTSGSIPRGLRRQLETRFASQLHVNPTPETDFLFLNIHEPPFDDIRVRRALNFAIDRDRVVRLYGGPSVATPTCQVLPPGLPGYRRYCPYTLAPRREGRWTAPDLGTARRLVADSGARGTRVVVWTYQDAPAAAVSRYAAAVLRRLGFRAVARVAPFPAWDRAVHDPGKHVQIAFGAWLADYPAASDFFNLLLSCHGTGNPLGYCDAGVDREIERALSLAATDPRAADRVWRGLDRRVTDLAAWAPLVNVFATDFVSRRVGNYQYNPLWGILADQLWVR